MKKLINRKFEGRSDRSVRRRDNTPEADSHRKKGPEGGMAAAGCHRKAATAGYKALRNVGLCLGILVLLAAVSWLLLAGGSFRVPVTTAQLEELVPDSVTRIMIVAHPDDETFWGGAHLAAEPYLVVCLTSGDNAVRRNEFEQAVRLAGSVPLILEYPDKVFGIRSRWTGCMDDIAKDLSVLLKYKDWQVVATHNPYGEYGHIHHIRTSRMVTRAVAFCPDAQLYYFGTYYTPQQLEAAGRDDTLPPRQQEKEMQVKQQMTGIYQSQGKVVEEFCHMFAYEEWYSANKTDQTTLHHLAIK